MTDKDDIANLDKIREEIRQERRHGDRHKAYLALQEVLGSPHAELRDFFMGGECALSLHLFSDTVDYLSNTISLSKKIGDDYFLDQAYFWRAYALFKLKRFDLAALDVAVIRDVDIPFYVYSVIPEKEVFAYSPRELEDMIRNATDS